MKLIEKTENNGLLFIGTWGISGPIYGHSWLKLARIATTKVQYTTNMFTHSQNCT
jgi:hypothetical protein